MTITMEKTNAIFVGQVIQGKQIGRTIGFPTANLEVKSIESFPTLNGVYSVKVYFDEHQYKGVMNVGVKPTFNSGQREKMFEVHILDFNQDIYDEHLRIEVCSFIRHEKKFNTVEALIEQLKLDCLTSAEHLADFQAEKQRQKVLHQNSEIKVAEIHLPDIEFARYCEGEYGINRGIYNTIDKWFAEKGVVNIIKRRQHILHFLQWVTFYVKEKIKFGAKGLTEQLEHFLVKSMP